MSNKRIRLTEADLAARRTKLLDLVRDGRYTWEQIAQQAGYDSRGSAATDYRRIVTARRAEIEHSLDEQRADQLEGLQEIRRVAVEVMRRPHPFVQGGKVVRDGATDDDPGDPLFDDGPTLAAIDRIAKIDNQIADLLGLKAPVRVESDGSLTVKVVGMTDEDMETLK